ATIPKPMIGHYVYDPRIDGWASASPLPIEGGADHCNAAAVDGRVYVLGAIRWGTPFVDGRTFAYDPQIDSWSVVASMPRPRGASGVAVIGKRIYVAGGRSRGDATGRSVADFDVFDTESSTWAALPDMPTARDHLTAAAVERRFYAIGGRVSDALA